MATARAAVKQIDWSKLTVSLPKETVASLSAFRKRNDEARRILDELKQQRTDVDFDHYRKALKNQSIVDDAQKALTGFKAATYNVDAQIKAIDQFEAKAVSNHFPHTTSRLPLCSPRELPFDPSYDGTKVLSMI
jgi:F-type H+-transporting ATPase subunit d